MISKSFEKTIKKDIKIKSSSQELTEMQRKNINILRKKGYISIPDNFIDIMDKKYNDYQEFLNSQPEDIKKTILERDCI